MKTDPTIYSTSEEAWKAMQSAIGSAKTSIYWELYMFVDDEIGIPFFNVLESKAKKGVDVKLVVDSLGSFWLSRSRIQSLRSAGVDLRFFHERKRWYRGKWKQLWARTHRKVLIVDEKIGFIGGVNVAHAHKKWKDIHMRVEGPIVRLLGRAFAKSYLICGGEKSAVRHLLRQRNLTKRDKKNGLRLVYDSPTTRSTIGARSRYTKALLRAKKRVILFSPYYFPDKQFLKALWRARKRGVRIDLLIPFRTDLRLLTYAAYTWFSLMKTFGVHVHLSKEMMHGKGVIVDDDWAMVGSSNIDHTSFYDNYEANITIEDKKTVKRLKDIIVGWLESATTPERLQWDKRGRIHKAKEWIALRLYRLWHGKR